MSLRAKSYRICFNVYSRIKGRNSIRIWKFLERSQWWSSEELQNFQHKEVERLIEYVYEYVPFYRRVMKENGYKPKDFRTTDDLIRFPVLTKDILRTNWNDLISTQVSLRTSFRNTGGSTGEPLKIMNDYKNGDWENATFRRGLGFAGKKPGDSVIQIFGGSLGLSPEGLTRKLISLFAGEIHLPALEINQGNLPQHIEKIKKSKARFIHGYCSAIYLLAKLINEAGISLKMDAIFPSSETLYDFQRNEIEKAFQCRVFNQYGCGESNSIAIECEIHDGLHVSDEQVFLEALDNDVRVPYGDMGALTLTTLQARGMPLIRYQNGDIVSLSRRSCSCGRGLSMISNLYGRANDMLRAKDGTLISATFLPSFCVNVSFTSIQQFQVIQNVEDKLLLKIVKSSNFDESDLDPLKAVFHRYLGEIEIETEYVDEIPTTQQEKLKYVSSKFGNILLS